MSAVGVCAAGDRAASKDFLRARCETTGIGRDCRILNLSARQVFVESFVPEVTGTKVSLRFCLPNGHQVHTAGIVSNYQFQVGFRVDFLNLSPTDCEQINNLTA